MTGKKSLTLIQSHWYLNINTPTSLFGVILYIKKQIDKNVKT